ncbi:MAG TPA: hypothetical protein VLA88_05670 [Candidatus Saccharimonadales bacterium]|nr:hypothetical protein [Candidatus Saccharimonadales bacterium]
MTERTYEFIGRVSRLVYYGVSSSYVSLSASSGGYFGFLVRDLRTNQLLFPVQAGYGFTLSAENNTPIMAAFPALLGNASGMALNLYPECEVLDPGTMPITHVLEALPNKVVSLTGLRRPGELYRPFLADEGGTFTYGGTRLDRIEVFYRYPLDPTDIPGIPAGAVPRGGEDRIYATEAHSFGVVHFVDRVEMAQLLAADGQGNFDPANDRHWSIAYLHDLGERLLVDIALEPPAM